DRQSAAGRSGSARTDQEACDARSLAFLSQTARQETPACCCSRPKGTRGARLGTSQNRVVGALHFGRRLQQRNYCILMLWASMSCFQLAISSSICWRICSGVVGVALLPPSLSLALMSGSASAQCSSALRRST